MQILFQQASISLYESLTSILLRFSFAAISFENLMESNEEESQTKTQLFYLLSVIVSVTGGFVIGWWAYKYRPDDEELWMVPFGLILFATPILVLFSVFVNFLWNSDNEIQHVWTASPRVLPVDDDQEKGSEN